MSDKKNIYELPDLLTQKYFSTEFYFEKGYMVNWIWNSATEKGITELTIDIIHETIKPNSLRIEPILTYLPNLKEMIEKNVKSEGLPIDFITQGKFYIKIFEKENRLRCRSIIKDSEGKNYYGKEFLEYPYDNNFKVFNSRSKNDMDWANEAENSLNSSEWFGAIIRYLAHLGKRNFNSFIIKMICLLAYKLKGL
jgi:hypothetical protein